MRSPSSFSEGTLLQLFTLGLYDRSCSSTVHSLKTGENNSVPFTKHPKSRKYFIEFFKSLNMFITFKYCRNARFMEWWSSNFFFMYQHVTIFVCLRKFHFWTTICLVFSINTIAHLQFTNVFWILINTNANLGRFKLFQKISHFYCKWDYFKILNY